MDYKTYGCSLPPWSFRFVASLPANPAYGQTASWSCRPASAPNQSPSEDLLSNASRDSSNALPPSSGCAMSAVRSLYAAVRSFSLYCVIVSFTFTRFRFWYSRSELLCVCPLPLSQGKWYKFTELWHQNYTIPLLHQYGFICHILPGDLNILFLFDRLSAVFILCYFTLHLDSPADDILPSLVYLMYGWMGRWKSKVE